MANSSFFILVIWLCQSTNKTIQVIINDNTTQMEIMSELSLTVPCTVNPSRCNDALEGSISLSQSCNRAMETIFDAMSELRNSIYSRHRYALLQDQFDDFDIYTKVLIVDNSLDAEDGIYAIFSATLKPLGIHVVLNETDQDRVESIINGKAFITTIMHDCGDNLSMHKQKYNAFFIENQEQVDNLRDQWRLIGDEFERVHQFKLLNLWNQIHVVVNKDILKIILYSNRSNAMDVQFYYNDVWILLLDYISRGSKWFSRKVFSDVFKFNSIASELIAAAKLQFNFSFVFDSEIHNAGRNLMRLTQNMTDKSIKKEIKLWVNAVIFNENMNPPYGVRTNVLKFFDVHHCMIFLKRAIHLETKTAKNITRSAKLALNYELLKMHKLNELYELMHHCHFAEFKMEEQVNTHMPIERSKCPDRNRCMLCLVMTLFSCFVLAILAIVWMAVELTK